MGNSSERQAELNALHPKPYCLLTARRLEGGGGRKDIPKRIRQPPPCIAIPIIMETMLYLASLDVSETLGYPD